MAEPDAPAPVVRIVITGEDAHRSDWARASTISRFFAGRVDNSTGSLAQLIEPTLREILFRRGYRVARSPMEDGTTESDSQAASGETDTAANDASDAASAHADYILEVKFLRNILAWMPPQTFIQTPGRYHVGNVRLGFYIEVRLVQAHTGEEVAGWDYQDVRELQTAEGQEAEAMALMAWQTLSAFLEQSLNDMPAATALESRP
ncbi:MAG: hypothetical protein KDK34_06785 [Leptospiraceae bacterium]|nr:hypothetical protein [Leptospiraceae bacterium]